MGKRKKGGRLTSSLVTSSSSSQGRLHTDKVNLTRIRRDRIALQEEQRRLRSHISSDLEVDPTDQFDDFELNNASSSHDFMGQNSDEDEQEERIQRRTEASHDGYVIDDAQREVVESYYHFIQPERRRPQRSRLFRNRAMHAEWHSQTPSLVTAYLLWKHGTSATSGSVSYFEVTVVDIKDRIQLHKIYQASNELANVSLLKSGLLGCSPSNPSVAVTLECLEFYHQLRRRQSSFSIQAMCKVLCALHNVTYTPIFRAQLSTAFDIYLEILRRVKALVNEKLGRDSPDWRLQHACPSCSYKLEGECALVPARLQAMDGNMSLKRMDGSGYTDERVFVSDYHISPSAVDRFKDDLRPRHRASSKREQTAQGAPPFGDDQTVCTDNWTAAHATSEDTIQVFEQTGGFISACRHGLIQTFVEMRKSGELAKYGLATLHKLMTVFGDDQGVGSDIACSFTSTVHKSSLCEQANTHHLLLVLNAFHGHAHGRRCQLQYHPLYTPGIGLEDLETCERVFSASNSVARLVRHASYFHWLQFIDLHFQQWDDDKYLEISKFLYNNYRQALSVINEYTPIVEQFKRIHGYADSDFERWRLEEAAFLENAVKEADVDVLAVAYVEALQKLDAANAAWGRMTTVPWQHYTPASLMPTGTVPNHVQSQVNAHEGERRTAIKRLELAINVCHDLESRLGLTEPWTPEMPEYQEAVKYLLNRKFIRAVTELESLVVARLFELAKANLMGTCVKMRKHISKAITRRSAAIHTALEKYNALAPLQNPPRPRLDKDAVTSYALLADFELLRLSRHDVLQQPWAIPGHREVAAKYFKIIRAREEIQRLNVEIRRLHTWTTDEDYLLRTKAKELAAEDPLIAAEVQQYWESRSRVNNVHRMRLNAIHHISGYSGSWTPGIALGTMLDNVTLIPDEPNHTRSLNEMTMEDLHGDAEMEIIEDDLAHDEVLRLGDILENTRL